MQTDGLDKLKPNFHSAFSVSLSEGSKVETKGNSGIWETKNVLQVILLKEALSLII